MEKVLIVVAHPDDEVLGCGGSIVKHLSKGDAVHVMIMADGMACRARARGEHTYNVTELRHATEAAMEELGVTSYTRFNLPDNEMDTIPLIDIVKKIETHVKTYQPTVVYTHYISDLNIDHERVARATITACRPQPGSSVKRLLFMEIASSTEYNLNPTTVFSPSWFIDITPHWDAKSKALDAYNDEMRDWPHPRSVEGLHTLASLRGSMRGMELAEAFMVGYNLE